MVLVKYIQEYILGFGFTSPREFESKNADASEKNTDKREVQNMIPNECTEMDVTEQASQNTQSRQGRSRKKC